MRRREFIAILGGGAAFASPRVGRAQQTSNLARIALLMTLAEDDRQGQAFVTVFREGLQKLGLTEGRNIRIDIHRATPDVESIRRVARDLVALQPELILSANTATTAALLQQTRSIPIVFVNVSDPVGEGLVASLSRPGSNFTGFSNLEPRMAGKWLELLKEVAPRVARVAALFNPAAAPGGGSYFSGPFKAAAASLGLDATAEPVRDESQLESVIVAHARAPHGGLIVLPDAFMVAHRANITSLAARYRLPAVYPFRVFAEFGGLLTYGSDLLDNWRRAAAYADRILKGEKPGALPVQSPVRFELTINLKTAKILGLDVPLFLQQRADEVIE